MKIYNMRPAQLAAVVEKVPPAVKRILEDPDLKAGVEKWAAQKAVNPTAGMLQLVTLLAPALLGPHFDDTVLILSVLTGKSEKRIRRQRIRTTMRDLKKCMSKDLLDFFPHAGGTRSAKSTQRHGAEARHRPSQQ